MKKVLFCLSLIIGLLVLNSVPSFAMEASFETIGGLGDLGYSLIGGASFDFTDSDYVIGNYENLSEQLKAEAADRKAREFLQAYCMARGIPIPNIDPDLPASTGKEFYKSQYFNSANRTVWNNYKLGRTSVEQQAALRFPISPQAFNDWTEYNEFWYKKYISQFENVDSEFIPVEVPLEYQGYIENINYNLCYWDRINASTTAGYITLNKDWNETSWISNPNLVYGSYNGPFYVAPYDGILDVKIAGTDSNYSFTVSGNFLRPFAHVNDPNAGINPDWNNSNTVFFYQNAGGYQIINTGEFNAGTFSYTFTGTLGECLSYIQYRLFNVNIYVNNELWAYVGDAPANPLIPEFPDVIGGNDEDPLPAYDIVFPNTSDYEGTFDITSLFDALKEAIIGASDNDSTTDSTLTRDKVTSTYKDRVGEAVGEATKTIDEVMDDAFPIQGTLNYPALPPIPQIPIDNAFQGTTILSELIDACQQILPDALVLAFWGLIFILFIIGLIRILHK